MVGYSQVEVPNGKSLVTPVFKNVDSTKKFPLTNIKVLNHDGTEFGTSPDKALAGGKVTINKLSAAGAFQDIYTFIWTKSNKGWYDGSGTIPVGDTDVTFENGEGMLVTSQWAPKIDNVTTPTNVFFQASGEVDLYGKNMFPFGKSLAGNSLPRTIDLTEIKVLNENGEEFGTLPDKALSGGKVTITKLSTEGAFQDIYTFIWTKSNKGWYDGSGTIPVNVGEITLKPGEAFLLTNGWKTKGTDERIIYLQMPNPLDPMPVPEAK